MKPRDDLVPPTQAGKLISNRLDASIKYRKDPALWERLERQRLSLFLTDKDRIDRVIAAKIESFTKPKSIADINHEVSILSGFYERVNDLWIEKAGMKKVKINS